MFNMRMPVLGFLSLSWGFSFIATCPAAAAAAAEVDEVSIAWQAPLAQQRGELAALRAPVVGKAQHLAIDGVAGSVQPLHHQRHVAGDHLQLLEDHLYLQREGHDDGVGLCVVAELQPHPVRGRAPGAVKCLSDDSLESAVFTRTYWKNDVQPSCGVGKRPRVNLWRIIPFKLI